MSVREIPNGDCAYQVLLQVALHYNSPVIDLPCGIAALRLR